MGNDAPLACLSEFQPLLYEYFKQLFAQVRDKNLTIHNSTYRIIKENYLKIFYQIQSNIYLMRVRVLTRSTQL